MHNIGDLVLGQTKGLGQVIGMTTDFFSMLPRYYINWFRSDDRGWYSEVDMKWFKTILKTYEDDKKRI